MTWPVGMPLIPVTADYSHMMPDGDAPTSCAVHLQCAVPALVLDGGASTVTRRTIVITGVAGVIDTAGTDDVPHLNHPDLSPTCYYTVREYLNGQLLREAWQLTPTAGATTLNLNALAPIAGTAGVPVAVGPPGPTAVSTDAGNVAVLGTDDLLYVGEAGISAAVEDYLIANPPAAGVTTLGGLDDVTIGDYEPGALIQDQGLGVWGPGIVPGNSAGLDVGTTAGTVAAGDDTRITGALAASGLDAAVAAYLTAHPLAVYPGGAILPTV